MNLFVHGAFNLLVNGMLSFAGALALVVGASVLLRVRGGRVLVAFLCLPFVKVLYDTALGIGANSFFWQRLGGGRQQLGSFRLGVGLSTFHLLFVDFRLASLYRGRWYPLSAADLLDTALSVKVSPRAPALVLFVLLAGGCVALLVRWFGWRRFALRARALRDDALRIDTRFVGRRRVPVLVSRQYDGPPFAAGLLRPYVLLPERGVGGLGEEQRRAVIEHELAHVRHFDVLLVGALLYVSTFFWFLPGVSWLVARIRAVVEQSADDAAVRAGADPVTLASALVAVAEALTLAPEAELAVGRSRGALLARATRLVSPARTRSRALGALRLLALALVGAGVLSSFFLGNHTITLH